MNYKKIYDQLVEKCRVRGLDKSALEGYYEKHHIVPKCMGGGEENENFVLFTGREHFIAHMLLWKMHPNVKGLAFAVNIMSNRTANKLTSRLYEKLKSEVFPRPSLTDGVMFKDKSGMKFGKLLVLRLVKWVPKHGNHNLPVWECQCDCGNLIDVRGNHLTPKGTKSCGCVLSNSMKLHSESKAPWERTKIEYRWLQADTYYRMWVRLGRPDTPYKFSKLYNEVSHTEFGKTYFKVIISHFNNGWIPEKDLKWLNFRDSQMEG